MFKKKDIVFLKEDSKFNLFTISDIEKNRAYIHCNATGTFYNQLISNLILHERPFAFLDNFKKYYIECHS